MANEGQVCHVEMGAVHYDVTPVASAGQDVIRFWLEAGAYGQRFLNLVVLETDAAWIDPLVSQRADNPDDY